MIGFKRAYTTEALIADCLKGKRKAQEHIYKKYAPVMLGVCIRYLKNQNEAEEIMVKGFMRVFEKIASFNSEGSFEGWIRRIMVNESLMYLRQMKRYQQDVSIDDMAYESLAYRETGELEAEDLLKLVQQLPEGYRVVFNLYAVEGYNHKEIADKLGISEGTSKSQLSKARSQLKKMIALQAKQEEVHYG
jgi:RNA polymerase sigma-70 factor (ECF subfamily)